MNLNLNNPLIRWIWKQLHGYDKDSYWRMRAHVIDPQSPRSRLIKLYYLYRIKKVDARNNASFGTDLNNGALFATPPKLPHGPNGIIVGHDTVVGANATIYHQVTIMHGNVVIGNNVYIGAGAKILPGVNIGNNVKIGANCVVIEDVPDDATVVMHKPRIIIKTQSEAPI